MLNLLNNLLNNLGYFGIIAFLALCGCGVPIPEEVPLFVAGVLSSNGQLDPWLAFGACLLGALLGDSIMYGIGRRFGHGWLTKHPMVARFVDADQEEKIEKAIRRRGFWLLLVSRFLVGVRGAAYYAAGSARIPYWKFLIWDAISATLVVGIVFWLAHRFGSGMLKLVQNTELALSVIVLVPALTGLYYFYKQQTKRMAAALEDLTEPRNDSAGDAASATEESPAPADAADSGLGHGTFAHGGLNGHDGGRSGGHETPRAESSRQAKS